MPKKPDFFICKECGAKVVHPNRPDDDIDLCLNCQYSKPHYAPRTPKQ